MEQNNIVKRCAVYTRVSTEEQGRGSDFTSIDNQRECSKDFIKSQKTVGWQVYPESYDDIGFSAKNIERPALKRLLTDIRQKKFDIVVAYKFDRLSRNIKDFVKILDIFEQYGVSFVAVTQRFDTSTSTGRMMMTMLMGFAQFERDIISERTHDKLKAMAEKGKWRGGVPIIGYDIKDKKLVVNENESEQAIDQFSFYLKEKSLSKAAKLLNAKNYRLKEWITKAGNKIGGRKYNKCNLAFILRNPLHIGKIRYKDTLYNGEHKSIIPDKLWNVVQKLLDKNGITHKSENQDKHNFLLKGLIRCNYCSSMMSPNFAYSPNNHKYFYYKCVKVYKMDKTACKIGSVPAREIEKIVIQRLAFLGNNKTIIEKITKKALESSYNELPTLEKEKVKLNREYTKIEQEGKNLVDILAKDEQKKNNDFVLTKLDEMQKSKNALSEKKEQIALEINKLQNRVIDAEIIRKNLQTFEKIFDKLTPVEQKELLQLLIKEVIYDEDNSKIKISLRQLPDINLFIQDKNVCFDESMVSLPG
ncbi:MAG: recombinase family protein [Elusimicrobia bacterium]|nr:recombinase family protein [Elusimicrobiota bacterium]